MVRMGAKMNVSNKVKISLIIPVYNVQNYLNECIYSLIKQSFDSYEIIFVDDGSTDESGLILDSYTRTEGITVVHTKNKGVSHARNTGIRLAKGKYLAFVDADDVVESDYLSTLYKIIEQNDADILECGYYTCSEEGTKINSYSVEKLKSYTGDEILELVKLMVGYSFDDMKLWLKTKSFSRGTTVWGRLYRKNILIDNDIWFDESVKIAEDLIFNMSVYLKCNKVTQCNYVGYRYRQRENSAIRSYLSDNNHYLVDNKKRLAVLRDIISQSIENPVKKEKVKSFYFGSLVLSCGEIAVSLAKNKSISFIEKTKLYNSYSKLQPVIEARSKLTLSDLDFKYYVALFLIKHNFSHILLLSLSILNRLGKGIKL